MLGFFRREVIHHSDAVTVTMWELSKPNSGNGVSQIDTLVVFMFSNQLKRPNWNRPLKHGPQLPFSYKIYLKKKKKNKVIAILEFFQNKTRIYREVFYVWFGMGVWLLAWGDRNLAQVFLKLVSCGLMCWTLCSSGYDRPLSCMSLHRPNQGQSAPYVFSFSSPLFFCVHLPSPASFFKSWC